MNKTFYTPNFGLFASLISKTLRLFKEATASTSLEFGWKAIFSTLFGKGPSVTSQSVT